MHAAVYGLSPTPVSYAVAQPVGGYAAAQPVASALQFQRPLAPAALPLPIVGLVAAPAAAPAKPPAKPREKAPCCDTELAPWIDAARDFEMNEDFDVRLPVAEGDALTPLNKVMQAMKDQSGGKRTIQALGDKIILSKLLENLGVPQMPMLFQTYTTVDALAVHNFVQNLHAAGDPEAFDVVVKPTHLSSGQGALILDRKKITETFTAPKLVEHMRKFLAKKADTIESEALRSLLPGFVIQPRYRSLIEFSAPLEMRVITLWGKARVGIWWWGRQGRDNKGQRTAWLVRRTNDQEKLSKDDSWEAIHEHVGKNDGFDEALAQFKEAMPLMATAAEDIATAVGAPFLRSDFFVGSTKWGVRLNEVAYGSGVDLLWCPTDAAPGTRLLDDSLVISQILQQGLKVAQRHPADYFLSRLGARGSSYINAPQARGINGSQVKSPGISVSPVLLEHRQVRLDSSARRGMLEGVEVKPITRSRCDTGHPESPMLAAARAQPGGNFRLASGIPMRPSVAYPMPLQSLGSPMGGRTYSAIAPVAVRPMLTHPVSFVATPVTPRPVAVYRH